MTIPKKIIVAGVEYAVIKQHPVLLNGNEVCYGSIEYNDSIIFIDNTYGEQTQLQTLLHEINHAIVWHYHVDLEDVEKTVDGIAGGMMQVLKQNPALVKCFERKER